jgi:hypothetical protein
MTLVAALKRGTGAVRGHRHGDDGQVVVYPDLTTERRIFSWPINPGPRSVDCEGVRYLAERGWTDWQPLSNELLS